MFAIIDSVFCIVIKIINTPCTSTLNGMFMLWLVVCTKVIKTGERQCMFKQIAIVILY